MSHSLVLLRKEHTHEEKNPKKKKSFHMVSRVLPYFPPYFPLSVFHPPYFHLKRTHPKTND